MKNFGWFIFWAICFCSEFARSQKIEVLSAQARHFETHSIRSLNSFDRTYDFSSKDLEDSLKRPTRVDHHSGEILRSKTSFDSPEEVDFFNLDTRLKLSDFEIRTLPDFEKQERFEKAEQFYRYFRNRINDTRFYAVDLRDNSTLDSLNQEDLEDFNMLVLRGAFRASEGFVVRLLDPQANRYSDLASKDIKNFFSFMKTSLRLGYTRTDSTYGPLFSKPNLQNPNNDKLSREDESLSGDPNRSPLEASILTELPKAEARSELFQDLFPGDLTVFGRFKTSFCGWGVDWKPFPDDVPLTLRVFHSHFYSGENRNCELTLNWDVLGFRDPHHPRNYNIVFNARYDTESDDTFFGLFFSNH